MKSLLALSMLATGCLEPSAEVITLSQARNLRIAVDLHSDFFKVRLFYDGVADIDDCHILDRSLSVTLAGTTMTVDPGTFRPDSDSYDCSIPEAYTSTLPSPFRGSLVLADRSRTITCEVGGRVMEDQYTAHFDCGGVANSVFVYSDAPPIE